MRTKARTGNAKKESSSLRREADIGVGRRDQDRWIHGHHLFLSLPVEILSRINGLKGKTVHGNRFKNAKQILSMAIPPGHSAATNILGNSGQSYLVLLGCENLIRNAVPKNVGFSVSPESPIRDGAEP